LFSHGSWLFALRHRPAARSGIYCMYGTSTTVPTNSTSLFMPLLTVIGDGDEGYVHGFQRRSACWKEHVFFLLML